MSRYKVIKEVTKEPGSPTLTQFCLYDKLEDRIVVRYAKKKDADALLLKYESTVKE
jgi:hypothetical protein